MLFGYPEPGDNFDEPVIEHASKFKVISTWQEQQGIKLENEQLKSL